VIPPALREDLLSRDPHNVVALELPEGPLDPSASDNRYETGGRRWRRWLADGVLAFDAVPAVYALEQRYRQAGKEITRRGFVAAVELEPFSAGIVLPHERTLPRAIEDRLNLTRATAANLSQVFGMFADPAHSTDELLDRAMSTPFLVIATDDDGVTSTVWALTSASDQAALASFMAECPIFIADGHHRYTTALAYRDEREAAEPRGDHAEDDAYRTVMMALVNMDDPGLVVYPTHRIVDAPAPLDPSSLRESISRRFELSEVPPEGFERALGAAADRPSFIVRTRDGVTMLAQLRLDVDNSAAFPPGTSEHWRNLDVAALQELVMSPLLDVHPDRPATLDRLSFSKDARAALGSAGEHDAVFVLRATRMDQVAAVASAGETMPQKSTYFYPKLLSGLLFKALDRL
jgi:uncharacterized protein (DUF1015 family)